MAGPNGSLARIAERLKANSGAWVSADALRVITPWAKDCIGKLRRRDGWCIVTRRRILGLSCSYEYKYDPGGDATQRRLGTSGSDADRFWSRVDKNAPNGCWLWIGTVTRGGYGVMHTVGGGRVIATRISLNLSGVDVPDDLYVLHRCDNPPCVNPAHLFVGSAADNAKDAALKGRIPQSRLSADDVRTIRDMKSGGESAREIARVFRISKSHVYGIVRGRERRHVV
jgi:hypothetical protein